MDTSNSTIQLEGRYVLPRNMEISDIENVYKDTLEHVKKTYKKFVLDAGEVTLIDTAGVQFLVQLLLALRNTGCEVSWENDSVQIYQMAAELGVADKLES